MAQRNPRDIDKLLQERFFKVNPYNMKHHNQDLVPFHSTTYDDAWLIIIHLRKCTEEQRDRFINFLKLRLYRRMKTMRWKEVTTDFVLMQMTPLDMCMAALEMGGLKL